MEPDSSGLDWQTEIRGVDLRGLSTVTRTVEETFPVSTSPELFVSNRYGDISVTTWDNRVIRVWVLITVGAEQASQAEVFARGIDIATNQENGRVEVQTGFPDTRNLGKVGYSVDYKISVPRDTAVVIENFFGDSLVRGLEGRVTINSSYGLVDLRDISGPVNVRAKGEFPLIAENLQQGGTFFLRSTQAAFSDVSGTLNVSNYLGSVELRSLGAVVDVDVTAESAPIRFYRRPPRSARKLRVLSSGQQG